MSLIYRRGEPARLVRGPLLYGNSLRNETSDVRVTSTFNFLVLRSFAFEGRVFARGEVLDSADLLARAVLASRPDLLEVTSERPQTRRP